MSRQIESAALTNTPTRIPRDVTLIRPMTGLSLPDFGELVRYRDLLWMLVLRDLKVRYKQTFFGAAWALLQPLLTMAAFSLFTMAIWNTSSQRRNNLIFCGLA